MTQDQAIQILSTYNPDHYPDLTFPSRGGFSEFHVKFNLQWSIIKFTNDYYNGAYELYSPEFLDDIARFPTFEACIDHILAIHPQLLFDPINSPERFL